MLAHNDNLPPGGKDQTKSDQSLNSLRSSKPKWWPHRPTAREPATCSIKPPNSDALLDGAALKQARRQRGLSQGDLADLIGVSQSRISAWENEYDEVPYKARLRLIDVLSNKRGVLDRIIRNLIDNDPYVTVYEPVLTDGMPDMTYLHLAKYPQFAFRDPVTSIGQRVSQHFKPNIWRDNRLVVSRQKFMVDVERDVITNRQFGSQSLMRVRSQHMHLEFDGRPNLVIARHMNLAKSTGAPMMVHNQLMLDSLDHSR